MLRVVYGSNVDQSLQNMNAFSSKQCLVSGARVAAYNLATERLIAASKAPINSSSNAHSSDTKNSIFTKINAQSGQFSHVWSQMLLTQALPIFYCS